MSDNGTRALAERDILSVLPERDHDLARLRILAETSHDPVVTVVGKYNHGKSRLLNVLVDSQAFSVADRRETITLAAHRHEGVCWLDAPGLDADVGTGDDQLAEQAVWLRSDIRLLVHAAKEGELDEAERELLCALQADERKTQRQTLFVLTQVDQFADESTLDSVIQAIQKQFPDILIYPVSSARHEKGTQEGKRLLIERSGVPALRAALGQALERVAGAREHEAGLRIKEIHQELQARHAACSVSLGNLLSKQAQQRADFDSGLAAALDKLHLDMLAVVDQLGPDHSLTPDASEDRYKMTAGKLERARLQIAYSRACLYLKGFLTGHGVIELPAAQQTAANSLNTVMVAVMGVSVKYRADLRRIFCEAAGRESLQRQFTHYYELSSDRQALAAEISRAQAQLNAIGKAQLAAGRLETTS